MAKKSNYVFPIERNTALDVVKIVKNFYLLEGASGEELLAKRSGLSTRLLLDGINDSVITQELLNNIYANLNNEEALINIVKENFQSIDYENALFLLRWTKDSQSPYYPRGMGEKPVEQFNEDYDFAKDLLISYINDHGLISIKNLPGRVIRVQKEIVKQMANNYRAIAIDEARKVLTANQEALVELRTSIKEQKQKIADLKAADENAQTGELEAKLKDDRCRAMEQYKIVKGQRRSLRDTLEERAILDRDFADVVGGRIVGKAQFDAEREEDDEKTSLVKRVLEIVKRTPEALPNPQQALSIVTLNVKGKYNDKEIKELFGEETIDNTAYVSQTVSNETDNDNDNSTNDINSDGGISPEDTATPQNQDVVLDGTGQDMNMVTPNEVENVVPQQEINNAQVIANTTPVVENTMQNGVNSFPQENNFVNQTPVVNESNSQMVNENNNQTINQNNGQEVFNAIYDKALEETEAQEQNELNAQQPQQPQQVYGEFVNTNPVDPNSPNV